MTDHRCEYPECDQIATEYYEITDEEGANFCLDHYEAAMDELDARRQEGPTFTSKVPTPIHDWLSQRPWEEIHARLQSPPGEHPQ